MERQRWEESEKRNEEERRSEKRKGQKKEDAGARKSRQVANCCVFPVICGSRGSKSRLAKAAGAEPSGQMRDEKLHAVVARSTCRSQNEQNTAAPEHFWTLWCGKNGRRCGAKRLQNTSSVGPLLEIEMLKKCTALWCKARSELKTEKKSHVRAPFGRWSVVLCSAPCQKWAKREGFGAFPKMMASVRHLKRICKDACRVAGGAQETRDVRRSGRWFPERGCSLEHQIFRFAKVILRDRCNTSYDLASLFRGRRSTLDRWSGTIAKTQWYETISAALNIPFLKEVSQNFFVFDVVNLKNRENFAEFFRFWLCQRRKLRKSRRLASFLMQTCLAFKLAEGQIDR